MGKKRTERCTGTAVAVAAGLLELLVPASSAHIMLFLSGAATTGPGAIVGTDRSEALRSHFVRPFTNPLIQAPCHLPFASLL